MKIETYIYETCMLQEADDPMDFIGFTRAYEWAVWHMEFRQGDRHIYMSDLAPLITTIRGGVAWEHFRDMPVSFKNGNIILGGNDRILRQLKTLVECQDDLTVDEFYWEFEEIHPWKDGNGRVGSILWNYKNGTLTNPVHPPQRSTWSPLSAVNAEH